MTKKDEKMVEQVRAISKSGNNAEVKLDKNGNWIIYAVNKKKLVG